MSNRELSPDTFDKQDRIREAILQDGSIVRYAAAGKNISDYDPAKFKLIGRGWIYSIDGVLQSLAPQQMQYFFERIV